MYEIKNAAGVVLEKHERIRDAQRAFWILTAHELKNGRKASLTLDTHSCDSVPAPILVDLPSWAVTVLMDVVRAHLLKQN